MDQKFIEIVQGIDWVFAAVILIGGRYWGSKYFTISKNKALNFLAFATAFASVWLLIENWMGVLTRDEAGNLFLTYLFTTAFYEIIAKWAFERIEGLFKKPKTDTDV